MWSYSTFIPLSEDIHLSQFHLMIDKNISGGGKKLETKHCPQPGESSAGATWMVKMVTMV
jgi:hypothetical protein